MTEETIAMTQKAVDRLEVIQQVVSRQLRQKEAARPLGLSARQIKRLVARFKGEGSHGASVTSPGPAPRKRAVRCRSPGGNGAGPHTLRRLRPHPGL